MSDEIKNQLNTEDINIYKDIANEIKKETHTQVKNEISSETDKNNDSEIKEENNFIESSEPDNKVIDEITATTENKVDKSEDDADEEFELPDDCVEIVCPECNETVIIDSSNKCPRCGCEFEEIEKKYRLSKFGIFLGIVSSSIYALIIILLRFIKTPDKINSGSLFQMDAFRTTTLGVFLGMLTLTILTVIFFVLLDIIINKEAVYSPIINVSFIISILILSTFSILLFWQSEGNKLFYILTKFIFLLPLMELIGGVCCFVDLFIKPKSKLNK